MCASAAEDGLACREHALPVGLEGPRCRRCARRLPDALPDGATCASCRRSPPAFSRVFALADYRRDEAVRRWIGLLKYGGRRDLALWLGRLLAPAGGGLLVPVPLHPLRRWERGYDQARELARGMAACRGGELLRALVRGRRTAPQGAPGARSRSANVRGAFRVRSGELPRLRGAEVVLVDDVVTSGATADACARALRAAGATAVRVVCVARAGTPESEALPSGA